MQKKEEIPVIKAIQNSYSHYLYPLKVRLIMKSTVIYRIFSVIPLYQQLCDKDRIGGLMIWMFFLNAVDRGF